MSRESGDLTPLKAREVHKIGFNESVRLASRTLHVQTEVFVRQSLLVKTTVLEGGIVRFVDTQDCPIEGGTLQEIEAFVAAQHARNVERALSGAL